MSEERVPCTEVQGPVLQHSDDVGRSEERAPSESSWKDCVPTIHAEKVTITVR